MTKQQFINEAALPPKADTSRFFFYGGNVQSRLKVQNRKAVTVNVKYYKIKSICCTVFKNKLICLFFVFFICHQASVAQNVSAITDRNKILIGEQVMLQLKAEDINTATSFFQSWFNVTDSSGHIQVTKTDPVDTVNVNGLTTYLQKIYITSFDSGKWSIAPLQISLQERATGKETIFKTDSIILEVLPVDVSGLTTYHDIKDILDVEVKPDYMLYALIASGIIIAVLIIWFIIKFSKKKKPVYIVKGNLLENALQQIKTLQQENLIAAGSVKLFYIKLTFIIKYYFQEMLQLRSAESTSDELMVLLGVYLQDEKYRTAFYQFLRLADAVKFAKYIPAEEQNNQAVQTAITSLQHINALIKNI